MNTPTKIMESVSRNYRETTRPATLFYGSLIGGLVGFALPLYVGWEIGDYVKKTFEYGEILGTATKTIGALGLTFLVSNTTVPFGATGGMITSKAISVVTGKVKKSLEKLVSKK